MKPLEGSVALVTGASRGIGAATALELARLGAHCVLTARTQGALEELDDRIRAAGGQATLFPLDLIKDGEKLDLLGPSILNRFGRLDILVHAAGLLAKLTPVAHIMPRDWQEAVAVNLSATWRLIRTCDPPLRAAAAGRAVVLTDTVAAEPRAYWGLYGFGKAGQRHLALSWAAEVANTPLRVNLFDPGPVATQLRGTAMPGENPASLTQPAEVAPSIAALCLAEETRHGAVIPFSRG
ncbi:SDR family NAD(P)-dependent oxidoreductase [Siccirubricoccus sp. KC 17139]|uniref:SDR family NAD(P)-dependent oxidoreductase n=1 Tax=Siccirubricoccus soli TaxID=2899147 RepID=A0ABT1D1V8_9PROT|nr:SDR family NAD(P)-dependent oxidoreductase [Siccirubricoccus soli]MCO6415888.1 SDR family NAD(P)-dependent oxidoreductase [Siccirubricoccus soli]MCP2682020.1 SDR family NAD(P)-dependent oxidoreductase [Siccirubricoccus soli]